MDTMKDKIQSSGPVLEKISHNMGEKIGSFASDVTDSTSDYLETGRSYVSQHPIEGVAIAVAAGAVAGSLVVLAMRRKH